MTIDEACALKNRTPVQLASGAIGAIVVWHKATAVLGVAVPGQHVLYNVPCSQLTIDGAGRVVESSAGDR